MKLDMGKAWNDATAMIAANRDVVLVVAGVFFFLPYLALVLLMPNTFEAELQAEAQDLTAALEAMTAIYAEIWWALLLMAVAQIVGTLALMILLSDQSRPTVGQALAGGARGLLPYIGTQILVLMGALLGLVAPMWLAATSGSAAITLLVGLVLVTVAVYVFIKISLMVPAIAIDGMTNPFAIIRRSWGLTKGNSFRLLAFYFLLGLAFLVITLVVSMIFGLAFAVVGGQTEAIGMGLVTSLINAGYVVIFLAVLTAVHRQFAGAPVDEIGEMHK